ncbi:MAG: dihydroorotase, partial [Alphaproteobacteria bacterium]|nr:dihydroorotase [Alphaproteobacteria bacterium]
MTKTYDLILKNGTVVSPGGEEHVDVAINGEKIVAIGKFDASQAGKVYDATGLHILPGVIDS